MTLADACLRDHQPKSKQDVAVVSRTWLAQVLLCAEEVYPVELPAREQAFLDAYAFLLAEARTIERRGGPVLADAVRRAARALLDRQKVPEPGSVEEKNPEPGGSAAPRPERAGGEA